MKLSWYLLKRFLLSLLAIVLISLALIGTNLSLQLGALIAQWYLPALSVGSINGDLWRGFSLHDLQYQDEQQQLKLQNLQGRLDWRCFTHSALCLHYLKLEGAAIQIFTAQEKSEANNLVTVPAAPFPIRIDEISLHNFHLQRPQLQLQLGVLQSSLSWQQDKLALGDSLIRQFKAQQQTAQQQPGTPNTKLKPKAKTSVAAPQGWQLPPVPALPDLSSIQLPLQLSIKSLTLDNIELLDADRPQLQLTKAQLQANFSHLRWQLTIADFDAKTPLFRFRSELDIKPKQQQAIQLQLEITKQPWFSEQQLELSLQGPLASLALDAKLLGAQQAALSGTLDVSKTQAEFDLKLRSDALQYIMPPAQTMDANANAEATGSRTYRLGNLQLQLKGSTAAFDFLADSQLQLPDLPTAKLKFAARYQATPGTVQIQQLDIQTLGGDLQATATVDLAKQQLQTELLLHQLQPGLFWADYPGSLSGKLSLNADVQPAAIKLDLPVIELQGDLRDLPLQLKGSLSLEQQDEFWALQSPGLTMSHGPNQLSAKGLLTEQWDAELALHMPDLSQSVAQSEGRLSGVIRLTGAAKTPSLQLELTGEQLNYQDDYALATFRLHGTLAALGQQNSSLSFSAKEGQAPGIQLQQLDWQLSGTAQQHQSHLQLDSHQLQAAIAMEGRLDSQSWQANWQEARLKSDMGDWQLQQSLQTSWQRQQQTLTLSPSCWHDNQAKLCLKADQALSATAGAISAELTQLDLAALSALLEQHQSLNGRVDGTVTLGWQPKQLPSFTLRLQGSAGQFNYQSTSLLEVPWQQLSLSASLQNNELQSELRLIFSEKSDARLALRLQQLNSADKTMDARFQLNAMDLSFLRPLLNDYSQFQAELNGDISATGALEHPELRGSLALENLTLTGRQAPMDIQEARLKLSLNGFSGNLAGELVTPSGQLNMTGNADWQQSALWYAKLALKGEQVSVHLPNTTLTLSPDLQFNADASGGRLTGVVHIPQGNIEVDDLPQNATKVSDDEILINTQDLDYVATEQWQLSSDVKVLLGDDVRLAAFGLKTRLEGELRVRQNGKQPTVHGQVNLQNGTFRAYGQDLQLRKGRLNFNGPADEPLMAIEAIRNPEKTEDGVIAGLRVSGLADSPVVEVFSTPAKPQANALAYLLMGRDLNSNSSDKSMTTSLIGIGIASSGKLVGELGEVFGLKELSLDTAGSGTDSKVTVSGYLSPKLQVKYGVGIFTPFGEFTLRYRLMKKLYLEAVKSVNTSVDLLYKVEFD